MAAVIKLAAIWSVAAFAEFVAESALFLVQIHLPAATAAKATLAFSNICYYDYAQCLF